VQAVAMRNPVGLIIYAIFSYPLVAALGVPSFLLFRRLGWLSLPHLVFAGLFLGMVSAMLLSATFGWELESYAPQSIAMSLVIFAVHGAIAASAFWFIGLRGRGSNIAVKRDAPQAARPLP
jgi:hypothetical protein